MIFTVFTLNGMRYNEADTCPLAVGTFFVVIFILSWSCILSGQDAVVLSWGEELDTTVQVAPKAPF